MDEWKNPPPPHPPPHLASLLKLSFAPCFCFRQNALVMGVALRSRSRDFGEVGAFTFASELADPPPAFPTRWGRTGGVDTADALPLGPD